MVRVNDGTAAVVGVYVDNGDLVGVFLDCGGLTTDYSRFGKFSI